MERMERIITEEGDRGMEKEDIERRMRRMIREVEKVLRRTRGKRGG